MMPVGEALTILMEFIVLCRGSVSLIVMPSDITHFIAYKNIATCFVVFLGTSSVPLPTFTEVLPDIK